MNAVACLKESLQFCMAVAADCECAPSPLEMESKICVCLKLLPLDFAHKVVFYLAFGVGQQYHYSDINILNYL